MNLGRPAVILVTHIRLLFLLPIMTQFMNRARENLMSAFYELRHIRVNTRVIIKLAPQEICEHL